MRNELEFWRPGALGRSGWAIDDLQRNFNRMLEEVFEGAAPSFEETPRFGALYDIEEGDNYYLLNFDVPGVHKEDIKIEVTGNTLFISGERKEERKEKKGARGYERRYGTFRRSFTLPQLARADQIEASCENGVLKVYIPKSEEAKPKQVKIGEGKGLLKGLMDKKEKEAQKIPIQ